MGVVFGFRVGFGRSAASDSRTGFTLAMEMLLTVGGGSRVGGGGRYGEMDEEEGEE